MSLSLDLSTELLDLFEHLLFVEAGSGDFHQGFLQCDIINSRESTPSKLLVVFNVGGSQQIQILSRERKFKVTEMKETFDALAKEISFLLHLFHRIRRELQNRISVK